MDGDALFDEVMQRTSSSARHSDRDTRDRDRDRRRSRDRERDRDREHSRKKSRSSREIAGDDKATWKPGAPLPDQEAMFQAAPTGRSERSSGGKICFDFQRGRCSRGDSCRFLHNASATAGGGHTSTGEPTPEQFSVHRGEVRSIQSYGVFVHLPGFKDGLVHVSQMAGYRVEDPNDIVSVGEQVWVKVLDVGADQKLSLSMKLVDQTTGRDEDPDHTEAAMGAERKGGGGRQGPIQFSENTALGAVSLNKDQQMGGGHYDLVGSEEEEAYQAEADMEAMWAMREAGVEDGIAVVGQQSRTAKVDSSAAVPSVTDRAAELLAREMAREKRSKERKRKKHKKRKKKSSKSKKEKKHKRGSSSNSSST